jgi:DNA-binding transcriptional LysR family regulator
MEIETLRAFLKVAEIGSISAAAITMGLTQSSLSRTIAKLEEAFGGKLFHRTGRGLAITEAGLAALPRVRNIVAEFDELRAFLREEDKVSSGLVTLAIMPTLTAAVAGPLFDQVRRSHPGIRLQLLEGFSASISEWIANGRADIALVSRYSKSDARKDEILGVSHLMLVGSGPQAQGGRDITFREVSRLPLVLPGIPNGTRLAIDRVAGNAGVTLNVIAEADSLEAQKAMIGQPGCFTLLDLQAVQREIKLGLVHARPVVAPRIERIVVISTTPQRPVSRATKSVIAIIRRLYRGVQ